MPGTSCEKCTFSVYEGKNQTGCLLDRLDKYDNVDILSEDYSYTYKVLPSNVCAGKRDKKWLSQNPSNPTSAVRRELFPKIQLIVLINELSDRWVEFFAREDFSNYATVDVLVFSTEMDYLKSLGSLLSKRNFFLHACYPVTEGLCTFHQHHINYLIREDCQFYLMVDNPDNAYVTYWPDKVDNYLNDQCKSLYMVDGENSLIYTPLHFMLGGNGSQCIEEKINIYCINNNQTNLVVTVDELWQESVFGDEPTYNIEENNGSIE